MIDQLYHYLSNVNDVTTTKVAWGIKWPAVIHISYGYVNGGAAHRKPYKYIFIGEMMIKQDFGESYFETSPD